jgi:hypothetical protein
VLEFKRTHLYVCVFRCAYERACVRACVCVCVCVCVFDALNILNQRMHTEVASHTANQWTMQRLSCRRAIDKRKQRRCPPLKPSSLSSCDSRKAATVTRQRKTRRCLATRREKWEPSCCRKSMLRSSGKSPIDTMRRIGLRQETQLSLIWQPLRRRQPTPLHNATSRTFAVAASPKNREGVKLLIGSLLHHWKARSRLHIGSLCLRSRHICLRNRATKTGNDCGCGFPQ